MELEFVVHFGFTQMHWVVRKHWPAVVVLGLSLARNLRSEDSSYLELICICLAGVGVLMNLLVILLNGGMPVATSTDLIPEQDRAHYKPIDDRTRLRAFADWIDVGWAYYSPGDILIDLGAVGLIVRTVYLAVQ
jgi:hypothetical protein